MVAHDVELSASPGHREIDQIQSRARPLTRLNPADGGDEDKTHPVDLSRSEERVRFGGGRFGR